MGRASHKMRAPLFAASLLLVLLLLTSATLIPPTLSQEGIIHGDSSSSLPLPPTTPPTPLSAGCTSYPILPLCATYASTPIADRGSLEASFAAASHVVEVMTSAVCSLSLPNGCIDPHENTPAAVSSACHAAVTAYACKLAVANPRHGSEVSTHASTHASSSSDSSDSNSNSVHTHCVDAPAFPSADECHAMFDACGVESKSWVGKHGIARSFSRSSLCDPHHEDATWVQRSQPDL